MNQANMFSDTNQDLPLFSGTAPRAQRQDFTPGQASRQLDLLPKPEPWADETFCDVCNSNDCDDPIHQPDDEPMPPYEPEHPSAHDLETTTPLSSATV